MYIHTLVPVHQFFSSKSSLSLLPKYFGIFLCVSSLCSSLPGHFGMSLAPILTACPTHLTVLILPFPWVELFLILSLVFDPSREDNSAVLTNRGNDKNSILPGGDAVSLDESFLTFRKTVVPSKFRELEWEYNLTSSEDFDLQLC